MDPLLRIPLLRALSFVFGADKTSESSKLTHLDKVDDMGELFFLIQVLIEFMTDN